MGHRSVRALGGGGTVKKDKKSAESPTKGP